MTTAEPLLEGIRVLDFGRYIAGPYCAALLGDLGADVIRIERVEGGEDRCVPRVLPSGEGGMFLQSNRNKRCLTLDLGHGEGREILDRLLATADVVIANLAPHALRRLGLDHETLRKRDSRLILVTVSAFGSQGPLSDRAGFDSVGQAMSGAMFLSGRPGAPSRAAVTYVDFYTAQACATGVLAALMQRERSGEGRWIEGSLLLSSLVHTNGALIEEAVLAKARQPQGNRGYLAAPSDAFHTRDGWIVVQTIGDRMFEQWCDLVGQPAMKTDPRLSSDEDRARFSTEISAHMQAWCEGRTREEALAALAASRIPAAPVLSPSEALQHEQIAANAMLAPQILGDGSSYPLVRHPVDMSGMPTAPYRPAPGLGEHTDQILGELGFDRQRIAGWRERGIV